MTTPIASEPELPALPEPAMEDVPYELWGQNATHAALFTADQMRAYAIAALSSRSGSAAETEDTWRKIVRENDSEAHAMTELQYIRATNLAKIRATKQVLRDYHPENDDQEEEAAEIWKLLDKIEERLTKLVKTNG